MYRCSPINPNCLLHAGYVCPGRYQQWKSAAEFLDIALELLPEVIPNSKNRSDLQYTLRQLVGLSWWVGSIFLKAERTPLQAIQALELTRGIMISHGLDARSDISELKEKQPELWSLYIECRDRISIMESQASNSNEDVLSYAAVPHLREKLYGELRHIQAEVCKVPGFETFLLPMNEEQIKNLSRNGPIVYLNENIFSDETFVITSTAIEVIPLPDIRQVIMRKSLFRVARQENPNRRDAEVSDDSDADSDRDADAKESDGYTSRIEKWLQDIWRVVVKPVVTHLGFHGDQDSLKELPHIHWIGGFVPLLPLHAAGDHTPGSTENTISCAVSSYRSTLKALHFARLQELPLVLQGKPEIHVVSMPKTPGSYAPLNTAKEIAAIASHTSSWALLKELDRPSKEDFLAGLATCTLIHFACHGTTDPIKPDQSRLLLGSGQTAEALTIEDLSKVTRPRAQIAYLSACSTAEITQTYLVDESINIASTLQFIGFQHIIGTLWGVSHEADVEMAKIFYENLGRHRGIPDLSVAKV